MVQKKRHLNYGSAQFSDCYSSNELLRYRMGDITITERRKIFTHLNVNKCSRCRQIYNSLPEEMIPSTDGQEGTLLGIDGKCLELLQRRREKLKDKPKLVVPLRLADGQIWTTRTVIKDINGEIVGNVKVAVPVTITDSGNGLRDGGNIIRVVPVSVDIEFFCSGRSVCVEKDSPLAYPFLLSVANEIPMLAVNLGDYRGLVQKKKLDEFFKVRNLFLESKAPEPDNELEKWERREMEITEYLSAPVNYALCDDGDIAIELQSYSLAADDGEIDLSELNVHKLISTDEFNLVIIQKRERLLLRFFSEVCKPDEIKLGEYSFKMSEVEPNIYELDIGHIDQMRKVINLELFVDGRQFKVHCDFTQKK